MMFNTKIGKMRSGVARFFAYARERHAVHLRRAAGEPTPWTRDQIIQRYRFCNVYRELDKTTIWFRQHTRDPIRDKPEVLLATVVFRMLNRISSGEAVFLQNQMFGEGMTAWDQFLETGEAKVLRHALVTYCGRGPYVTGAYIISSPPGMSKLDGVMEIIERFQDGNWLDAAQSMRRRLWKMETAWEFLREFPYLGGFHSYEIVCDLRYTALLERAPDKLTWANPGPGARRGLNRIHDRPLGESIRREQCIEEMRELLVRSRTEWPQYSVDLVSLGTSVGRQKLPKWEMREVEHTLCEFDKYERVRLGQGEPRGRFP